MISLPFLSPKAWFALGLVSVVFFIGTLIAIPIILVRLPVDYFDERRHRSWLENYPPLLRITAYILKNLVGIVFLLAGIAMLFLPGQGVLTILLGISLMDFPGKRKLERKMIGSPSVLGAINTIRKKFGREPLVVHE
jgi:putative transmembrane protein PGPGW